MPNIKITASIEDYLETIYEHIENSHKIKAIDIAKNVIYKHRILCDFFVNILKIEKNEAEINACRIEHVITPAAFERIVDMVNNT